MRECADVIQASPYIPNPRCYLGFAHQACGIPYIRYATGNQEPSSHCYPQPRTCTTRRVARGVPSLTTSRTPVVLTFLGQVAQKATRLLTTGCCSCCTRLHLRKLYQLQAQLCQKLSTYVHPASITMATQRASYPPPHAFAAPCNCYWLLSLQQLPLLPAVTAWHCCIQSVVAEWRVSLLDRLVESLLLAVLHGSVQLREHIQGHGIPEQQRGMVLEEPLSQVEHEALLERVCRICRQRRCVHGRWTQYITQVGLP